MRKIGLITIFNSNYGNRLQNFALQYSLEKLNFNVVTIKNVSLLNKKKNNFEYLLRNIKFIFKKNDFVDSKKRERLFVKFNKNIKTTDYVFNWFFKWKLKEYDYFVVGSDQVWNPNIGRLTNYDLANFGFNCKKISYAASIGVSYLDEKYVNLLKNNLKKFNAISVREDAANCLIQSYCNLDSQVLIDPTMLLNAEEWDSVVSIPKQYNNEKFVLVYFLGDLSKNNENLINKFATRHNCKVINILNHKDIYYNTGPSEFLFLEKNAFMIFTDSFHSAVFSIIFNRPFIIFNREQECFNNMNSRIDTLLSKFKLDDRKISYNKNFDDYLIYNYDLAYSILEKERKKSFTFLRKYLK